MKNATRRDLYQEVTDRILVHLEEALASGLQWQKPYVPAPQAQPVNLDGREYRGINWWLLALADAPSGVWGTYRAWESWGAQVRAGERGTTITFWKRMQYRPKDGEDASASDDGRGWMLLKHYVVFSAEQVDGFDLAAWQAKHRPEPPKAAGAGEPHPIAEAALLAYHQQSGVLLSERASGPPSYSPSKDRIAMPARESFHSQGGFYATWMHEAVHSTGAKHRLDRNMSTRFGDKSYAMEELVAELGAAMGCAAVGVASNAREDHAAYLAHWIGVLKADKRAIFTVSSKSQAAVDLIMAASAEAEAEDKLPQAA